MRLKGKIAVITGGSRGIGREIAFQFLHEGATVIICAINKNTLLNTYREFETKFKGIDYFEIDIANKIKVNEMFDAIVNKFGTVDILVNNAGVSADAQLHKMTEEQWDTVLNVNLKGTFNCCSAVAKIMMQKQYGKIINISSVTALYGNFGQVNYTASKAGIIGMTKSMARELSRYNINVNVVAPGFIETDMLDKVPQKVLQMMKERTPLKRLGLSSEVAKACVFLSSDDASFITGAVLNVDGGITL